MLLVTEETEEEIGKVVTVEQIVQEKQEEMDQEDLEDLITNLIHYQQREFVKKDFQDVLQVILGSKIDILLVSNLMRDLRVMMESTFRQHQEAPTL